MCRKRLDIDDARGYTYCNTMREYTAHYKFKNEAGNVVVGHYNETKSSLDDLSSQVERECKAYYKEHFPEYGDICITGITKHASVSGIDYELLERMNAIRGMCELGYKVRAESKIRKRQPLKKAYVVFSDKWIQAYMVNLDRGEYAAILADELNVLDVEFIDGTTDRFFDFNLKPNFRSLGPKGLGKIAQQLKGKLSGMNIDERNALHTELKANGKANVFDVELALDDIEVEFLSKSGFSSATDKVGAIILDTALDEHLVEMGFIADIRAAIQNTRKDAGLSMDDKVFIELYCDTKSACIIDKFTTKLCSGVNATDVKLFPPANDEERTDMHELKMDDTILHAKLFKEIEN